MSEALTSKQRRFRVERTRCNCHEETCSCADYTLWDGETAVAKGMESLPMCVVANCANAGVAVEPTAPASNPQLPYLMRALARTCRMPPRDSGLESIANTVDRWADEVERLQLERDNFCDSYAARGRQVESLRKQLEERAAAKPAAPASKELLPCPFCGGPPRLEEQDGRFFVHCVALGPSSMPYVACFASMGENYDRNAMPDHMYGSADDAVAGWNKRHAPEPATTVSTELSTRLRDLVATDCDGAGFGASGDIAREAAAEFERLQQHVAELEGCGVECSEGFRRMQQRISELESDLYLLRNERDNLRDHVDYLKTVPSVEPAPASKQVIGSAEMFKAALKRAVPDETLQHSKPVLPDFERNRLDQRLRQIRGKESQPPGDSPELRNARLTIGALIASAGGRVVVTKDVLVNLDMGSEIETIYDPDSGSQVFTLQSGAEVGNRRDAAAAVDGNRHTADEADAGGNGPAGSGLRAVVSQSDCDEIAGILATQEHGPACECSTCISTELRQMDEVMGPAGES